MTGWHQTGIAGRSKLLYLLILSGLPFNPGISAVHISAESHVTSVAYQEVVLPCNYTVDHPDNPVNIRWDFGDNVVLERDSFREVHAGSGYQERVGLGDGCSLILINPCLNDSGKYTVDIYAFGDEKATYSAICVLKIRADEQKRTTESVSLVYRPSTAVYTTFHSPDHQSLAYNIIISYGILVFDILGLSVSLMYTAKVRSGRGQDRHRQNDNRILYIMLFIGALSFLFSLAVAVIGIATPGAFTFIWLTAPASGIASGIGTLVLLVFFFRIDPLPKDLKIILKRQTDAQKLPENIPEREDLRRNSADGIAL